MALWLRSISLRAISWASRGILHQAGITQLVSRWPTTLLRAPQGGFCYSQVPKKWVEAASSRLFSPKRCGAPGASWKQVGCCLGPLPRVPDHDQR